MVKRILAAGTAVCVLGTSGCAMLAHRDREVAYREGKAYHHYEHRTPRPERDEELTREAPLQATAVTIEDSVVIFRLSSGKECQVNSTRDVLVESRQTSRSSDGLAAVLGAAALASAVAWVAEEPPNSAYAEEATWGVAGLALGGMLAVTIALAGPRGAVGVTSSKYINETVLEGTWQPCVGKFYSGVAGVYFTDQSDTAGTQGVLGKGPVDELGRLSFSVASIGPNYWQSPVWRVSAAREFPIGNGVHNLLAADLNVAGDRAAAAAVQVAHEKKKLREAKARAEAAEAARAAEAEAQEAARAAALEAEAEAREAARQKRRNEERKLKEISQWFSDRYNSGCGHLYVGQEVRVCDELASQYHAEIGEIEFLGVNLFRWSGAIQGVGIACLSEGTVQGVGPKSVTVYLHEGRALNTRCGWVLER